jgi:hypothetical protein
MLLFASLYLNARNKIKETHRRSVSVLSEAHLCSEYQTKSTLSENGVPVKPKRTGPKISKYYLSPQELVSKCGLFQCRASYAAAIF